MNSPHDLNQRLAELLHKARAEAGMTQAELAAKTGMSRASIANIEIGVQSVSVYQLIRLAAALGLPPERLLPDISQPSANESDESRRLYAAYEAVISAE